MAQFMVSVTFMQPRVAYRYLIQSLVLLLFSSTMGVNEDIKTPE